MPGSFQRRWSRFQSYCFDRVDGATLGLFRVFWGIIMIFETHWLWLQLDNLHSDEYFHFWYKGLSWIRHFPEGWMTELEIVVMMLAAFFVTIGLGFRIATFVFLSGFTHLFYSEAGAYNNHFYLIILVNAVLLFSKADAHYSLRQWWRKRRTPDGRSDSTGVPRWNYLILQFQVVVVYVYGAIAKIDYDWMVHREPISAWLRYGEKAPGWLRTITGAEWFSYPAAYGGFLIDLICPFLLFHRKLRIPAIVVLLLFHFLNSQIFHIGLFPIMGVALVLLFFPANQFRGNREQYPATLGSGPVSRPVMVALVLYAAFQVLFPLRWHLVEPAHPSWTDVGHRFSWRMMLRARYATVDFRFSDPEVEPWIAEHPHLIPRLTPDAVKRASQYPNFIWQYTQALHGALTEHGFGDTKIYAHTATSLNGRPYYPSIDPHVDLARAGNPFFAVPDWLLPLPEGLPVDYTQIMPFADRERFAHEALLQYFAENPGPGARYFRNPPHETNAAPVPPPSGAPALPVGDP